ncbi:Uncharacterised protein [Mycobacterium tuberculosis]|uniref:Uncharacterized protein n=1 Tax=Mycobacterium tuberculosis TaxID=1773 RepID=A0A0U0R354_MYCTX|nr:Uncharacterised protein [Mycobacterium tuberculosis]CKS55799.1 Uncharacterised protein [Mycobacterium tuberculosis]CKT11963.1 Uncharacterised protein [Mycobacterium tuberculosis]CKT37502.1 Uncharacterised protein [Mycobacterium tuberculosis]COV72082.1 Uncharacterised protein [Mycobacterium tuberculosis]
MASPGVPPPYVHKGLTPAGQDAATNSSTKSCSGASTRYVAPNKVSGRVVNTSMSTSNPSSLAALAENSATAPVERPIQLRCMVLTCSGQSSTSRSSSSRSA